MPVDREKLREAVKAVTHVEPMRELCRQLLAELDAKDAEIRGLRYERIHAIADSNVANVQVESLREQLEQKDAEIARLKTAYGSACEEIARLTAEIKRRIAELVELSRKMHDVGNENERLRARVEEAVNRLDHLTCCTCWMEFETEREESIRFLDQEEPK